MSLRTGWELSLPFPARHIPWAGVGKLMVSWWDHSDFPQTCSVLQPERRLPIRLFETNPRRKMGKYEKIVRYPHTQWIQKNDDVTNEYTFSFHLQGRCCMYQFAIAFIRNTKDKPLNNTEDIYISHPSLPQNNHTRLQLLKTSCPHFCLVLPFLPSPFHWSKNRTLEPKCIMNFFLFPISQSRSRERVNTQPPTGNYQYSTPIQKFCVYCTGWWKQNPPAKKLPAPRL